MTPEPSCLLAIRATPRASRTSVEGGDPVKVRVTAAPTDGQANDAIERAIADALKIAPSRVAVVRGQSSRDKTVRIDGLDRDEAMRRLGG